MMRSNWVRTFMASCGSMRSSPISSSRASVKLEPRLWVQRQPRTHATRLSPRDASQRKWRRRDTVALLRKPLPSDKVATIPSMTIEIVEVG